MDMKVNSANLQVYNQGVSQRQPAAIPTESKPSEPTQLAHARFADLLSAQEKKFIVQNFKSESAPRKPESHLGKAIDIRA